MKRITLAALVATLVLFAPLARAEPARDPVDRSGCRAEGTCEYDFDDDPVHMAGTSPYATVIRGRHAMLRTLLIRPRTSFVPELLTAVQHL